MSMLDKITKYKQSKLILLITIISLVVAGYIVYREFSLSQFNKEVAGAEVEQVSVFEPALAPIFATPTRLLIQKITPVGEAESPVENTEANIQKLIDISLSQVAVEPDGQLETPKNWNEGGWYAKSAKPGEHGNIIINAHYDTNTGAPAAFYQLKNVVIGDKVFLVDELGKYYAYTVSDLFYVDIQDPDRLKIFDDVDGRSELTLITCGGVFLPGQGYNKRLVVKANLETE